MNLVSNIKRICKERGTTIMAVEEAAGLPKNSIYKWDQNNPAYTKVVAVAAVLEVPLDVLVQEGCCNSLKEA